MTDESSGVQLLRRAFLMRVTVIVPAVITLVVLAFAFNAVYDYLDAFSSTVVAVSSGIGLPIVGAIPREVAIKIATPVVFVAGIVLLGAAVEPSRYGEHAVDYVDERSEDRESRRGDDGPQWDGDR